MLERDIRSNDQILFLPSWRLFENAEGCFFRAQASLALLLIGPRLAWGMLPRRAWPDRLGRENLPGGGAFALWLSCRRPYSPSRGCASASPKAKIPSLSNLPTFHTGSQTALLACGPPPGMASRQPRPGSGWRGNNPENHLFLRPDIGQ